MKHETIGTKGQKKGVQYFCNCGGIYRSHESIRVHIYRQNKKGDNMSMIEAIKKSAQNKIAETATKYVIKEYEAQRKKGKTQEEATAYLIDKINKGQK